MVGDTYMCEGELLLIAPLTFRVAYIQLLALDAAVIRGKHAMTAGSQLHAMKSIRICTRNADKSCRLVPPISLYTLKTIPPPSS